MRIKRSCLLLLSLLIIALSLTACGKKIGQVKEQPSNVSVGIARFSQPMSTADLLAGTLPEEYPTINSSVLGELDLAFDASLAGQLKRSYIRSNLAVPCEEGVSSKNRGLHSALKYWSEVGKCMKVDLILVPMAMKWREREGSQAGVVRPASVMLDFFLIDTRDETLVSRTRFDEAQAPLSDNLLDLDKFVKRGGKWVSAIDLSREGMLRAIKGMGL